MTRFTVALIMLTGYFVVLAGLFAVAAYWH